MVGDLKGELETNELVATCLNDELLLRGDEASCVNVPGETGDLMGEVMESRLLICKGDHPFAEEEMMEFRTADAAAFGDACRRSRA